MNILVDQILNFWLIFVFGMFPLIITHYLINYLANAYKNSQREIVDAEKICAKWDIAKVEQVVDMLGLMGDAVPVKTGGACSD